MLSATIHILKIKNTNEIIHSSCMEVFVHGNLHICIAFKFIFLSRKEIKIVRNTLNVFELIISTLVNNFY